MSRALAEEGGHRERAHARVAIWWLLRRDCFGHFVPSQ